MFGICLPNYYICNRNEKKIKQVNINLTIFKEMNKKLFFLAIAALGLAACSNDDVVEINQSNAISFRPLTNNVTRASEKTSWTTGDILDVFAEYKVGDADAAKFFKDNFTKVEDANFQSTAKYYWPAMTGNSMIFTAFYGVEQSSTTAGSITSAFTPATSASSQTDILYAHKTISNAAEQPVVLNFRHMLSQVAVNVKNSNNGLKFSITGVRIGYLSTSGTTFACTEETDGDGNLAQNTWTPAALTGEAVQKANLNKYDQTFSAFAVNGKVDEGLAITGFSNWMLIPQSQTTATAYAQSKSSGTSTDNPELNGAYIAIQMAIMNNDASGTSIIAQQWCYWPITLNWTPGYKYTYTVDLAGGGYQPTDKTNDGNLDPVLGTPIEISASCTIDAWDTSAIAIP